MSDLKVEKKCGRLIASAFLVFIGDFSYIATNY